VRLKRRFRRAAWPLAGAVGLLGLVAPLAVPASATSRPAFLPKPGGLVTNCAKAHFLPNPTLPANLDPATTLPPPSLIKVHDSAKDWGGPASAASIFPVPYTQVKITPAQAQRICKLHLKAVFLNWSNVTYNQAMIDGIRNEFNALGVRLIRVTDSEFSPTGVAGDVSAVMPLNPDIVIAGGTLNPSQMASLMGPVIRAHKILISWGNDGPGLALGPSGQLNALVGYDWYYLGLQMAKAIHDKYPHGVTLGYIHWINDVQAILLRESGLLDGLKKYPNIHVVAANGPACASCTNSGFSSPTATSAESYTESFLQTHKNVQVIFAPWENPPALGEAAAITALHLQNKVKVVTMDLAEAGTHSLAHGGLITVDMAQNIYDGGRIMAALGALRAIHAKYPRFVIVPTDAVTSKNYRNAWIYMHGPNIPCPPADC
jgi:ribose transport system substrate-binding protein